MVVLVRTVANMTSVNIQSRQAFTLIELLVVIAVVAILLAVAAPSFLGQQDKAHDSAAQQNLSVIYKVAKTDTVYTGNFPTGGQLVNLINRSEPQLNGQLTVTDSPSAGAMGVCASSTPSTLNVVAHSSSGNAFLLRAEARGAYRIDRGKCDGFSENATFDPSRPGDPDPDPGPPGEFVFSGYEPRTSETTANLYVMARNGVGEPTPLTTGNHGDGQPALSPDGTKVAFTRNGDIFVVNIDGSGVRNVTMTPDVHEHSPAWSADQSRIHAVSSNTSGNEEFTVINPAVPTAYPLFSGLSGMESLRTGTGLGSGLYEAVFSAESSRTPGRTAIWGYDAWNGMPALLVDANDGSTVADNRYPSFTDDHRLVYLRGDRIHVEGVGPVGPSGTKQDVIVGDDGRIYYSASDMGVQRIFAMNLDGSGIRAITPTSVNAVAPTR